MLLPGNVNMQNSGVSVVMAVYNGDRFLVEALESTLKQAASEFELIAVDDGSTDGSRRILEEYAARDSRLKIMSITHGGVPRAVNTGIRAARYDLIARMDSDDRMLPNRIERQRAFLESRPDLDVVCSYCYFINAAGKRIGSSARDIDVPAGLRECRPSRFLEITQSTVLMRKAACLEVGGYREDLPYAEDRELWGRFATSGRLIGVQPEYLMEFRLHGGSMTMKKATLQYEVCASIDCNIVRRLQGAPELSMPEFREWKRRQPLLGRIMQWMSFSSLHAFKRASRHYGEGRYCQCALTLAAAVSMNPFHILSRVISKMHIPVQQT